MRAFAHVQASLNIDAIANEFVNFFEERFGIAALLSTDEAASELQDLFSAANPQNPAKVYGKLKRVLVDVKSVTFPNASTAIVRFSNSSETIGPDGKGDARGMAVKLLDVEGTPAIPGSANRWQDFLTVNHPIFPFATPAEYVRLFRIRQTPLVGDLLAVSWLALFHSRHLKIVKTIRGKSAASPLDLRYWSGSPYWLGPPGTTAGRAQLRFLAGEFEGRGRRSACIRAGSGAAAAWGVTATAARRVRPSPSPPMRNRARCGSWWC
jgi:hypothetical protein